MKLGVALKRYCSNDSFIHTGIRHPETDGLHHLGLVACIGPILGRYPVRYFYGVTRRCTQLERLVTVDFQAWPKTPRLSNESYWVTEKIDGTNACIVIQNGEFACQSRSRFITPEDDNYGFARWAYEHKDELMQLGEGYHYGEWWGKGIQRTYGLEEKRFSLFDTNRWNPDNPHRPECCSVVPLIGRFSPEELSGVLADFVQGGSIAAPGFMKVEGLIVYSSLTRQRYKVIVDK